MKRFALFALAIAAMSTSSSAAQVEFHGSLCLTAVTAVCTAEGLVVGECHVMRYLPPNLGDNGASTRLSNLRQNAATNYTLISGSLIGTTLKNVDGTVVGRSGKTFTATMRITSQAPATLTATTNFVSLAGNVTIFEGNNGCNVGFRASGTRRPLP